MMIRAFITVFILVLLIGKESFAQLPYDSIKKEYVERTISYLASDKLKGRVNYTREQLQAAEFLGKELSSFGLSPFAGMSNFYVPFRNNLSLKGDEKLEWNERKMADSLFFFLPSGLITETSKLDDFMVLQVGYPLADSVIYYNWRSNFGKLLLWIPLPDTITIAEAFHHVLFPEGMPTSDILVVVAKDEPKSLKLSVDKDKLTSVLYNVVGMIPGDSLPNEAIIFSAHYDHVDHAHHAHNNPGEIFNGANDNASGTTAVLALAKYFAERRDNKRTLVFCLFAGEEIGLLGSYSFVNMLVPDAIKAVFNIEMIGMTNATGKNAFMVTGSAFSNFDAILRRNLKDDIVKVKPLNSDPYQLFRRSDNYPFALHGIPAHTLMCSDDHEPCYHRPCDDVKRLDLDNMTIIIRAIAKSATSMIQGTETPTRIKK